jgi:peptidoglycan/xylan/chitin deacetylase (PgdA/CDA1 family)
LLVPILMYHSISENSSPAFRPFTVTPETFEAQLRYLCENGYHTLTTTQFITAEGKLPQKPVILTFDDGFEDFHSVALPLLKQYGCTATLYMTTGEIGGTSRWLAADGEGDRPIMNWSQITDIMANGVEIGAHTVSHPPLDMLPLAQARDEIAQSKQTLEQHLETPITSFAYPFGYNSRAVREMVRDAGFSSACAVRYAMSSPDDNPFALARHIVRRDTDIRQFASILAGKPAFLPLVYDRLRSTIWTGVRRLKHLRSS